MTIHKSKIMSFLGAVLLGAISQLHAQQLQQQPPPAATSAKAYSGAPQNSIDRSPCESIKGKTYLSWNSGTFDGNPNTANSGQIVFDANGNGTTREFFSEYSTSKTADQITRTVTCAVYANDAGTLAGKSYLDFGGGAILAITSYDNGSRVWAEATYTGRLTKGWMLQLPPDPPPGSNLVK